ncbi:calmodulin-A-like [Homarus americanus]|uniref:calmodulin-A-like n=1 Tax=Homarus americanus TaxID=6706 RepID=UPI001C4441E8|nr:calmodulin-A-like [Homarus americanus]
MTNPTLSGDAQGDVAARRNDATDKAKRTSMVAKHSLGTNMSKTQLKEFREAFRLFDKDGDGTITKDELGLFMRNLGQFTTEEELDVILDEIDIDGDGTFSFNEFVEIVCNMSGGGERPGEDEEKELRDAFKIFDKHGRGYICASDLRAVLQCLGEDLSEEEIEDMIREVDIDGDGRIDFEEFVKALGENDDDDDDEPRDDEDEEEKKANTP